MSPIAYKAFADLVRKGVLFVITIACADRLAAEAFGIVALGEAFLVLGCAVALVMMHGRAGDIAGEVVTAS